MSDNTANDKPIVERAMSTPCCPKCARELEMRAEMRNRRGQVEVALVCPRHGSFPSGWRPKFLDHTQAELWALRQRRWLQQGRRTGRG